ncbi:MAG: hypothetical protein EA400_15790 [Chromatiaceae bacterium]|nr:MAG: hypothetical protein EA400_15790 [Chromatiaceae bacterium]
MEPPECVWDAEQGLVVLYRHAADRAPQADLSLVVAPDAAPAWYAGDFPADWPLWAIKAPGSGSFRLLGYPRGALPPTGPARRAAAAASPHPSIDPSIDPAADPSPGLADGSLFSIRFSAALRLDLRRPASPGHPIRAWLFHPPASGGQAPAVQPLSVPNDCSLVAALETWGWRPGGPVGLAAMCQTGGQTGGQTGHQPGRRLGNARGPLMTPLQGAAIDCIFTLVPDAEPPELTLPGFQHLQAPALALDLTAFGAAADNVRTAFWCFHHPHGPGRDIRHWSGHELPLVDDAEGRRLLVCRFDDACHLDRFGVYFASGARLHPRDDAEPDRAPTLALQGPAAAGGAECLVALFRGDTCHLLPSQAPRYAAVGREYCSDADPGGFDLPRAAAWLAADPRLGAAPDVDWHGAGAASAFTLLAYADVLTRLLAVPMSAAARAAHRQVQAQGLLAFAGFTRRPDLAFALLAEPALRARLAASATRPGALLDPTLTAPVAALAAALEPDAGDLGAWVAAASPSTQQALWQFLLAGGQASHWQALHLQPDDLPDDLAAFADRLRHAFAELPAWIVATRADLGQPPLPDLPLQRLADAEARAAGRTAAAAAVRAEFDGIAALLPRARARGGDALIQAFGAALDGGRVAATEVLRRRLLAALAGGDPRRLTLAMLVAELRTRAVLWGLSEWLAVRPMAAPEDPVAAGPATSSASALPVPTIDPAPAPLMNPTPAPTPEPAPELTPEPTLAPAPAPDAAPAAPAAAPRPQFAARPHGQSARRIALVELAPAPAPTPGPAAAPAPGPGPAVSPQSEPVSNLVSAAITADQPTPTPATTPTPLDPAAVLRWCDRVLARAAPDWPPPGGATAPLDAAVRTAQLAELYEVWGLDDPQPVALPAWTGARAAAHARHAAAIAATGWQMREALLAAGATGLLGLVDRLVAAREQLAADAVHAGLRAEIDAARAAARRPAGCQPHESAAALADLARQLGTSGPERWETIAAAADALDHPDPITDEDEHR